MNWEEFCSDVRSLSDQIKSDGFSPTIIVAVARGGWIPTRMLSSALSVKKIASIGLSYIDAERTKLDAYSMPSGISDNDSVLIVEDCLESGKSLERAVEIFSSIGGRVKSASVFTTDKTIYFPDYYVKKLPLPPKMPWE